jgi:hypothetical protein
MGVYGGIHPSRPPSPPNAYIGSRCYIKRIFFQRDFFDRKNLNEKNFWEKISFIPEAKTKIFSGKNFNIQEKQILGLVKYYLILSFSIVNICILD